MTDLIQFAIDFILHLDKHLAEIVLDYQNWTYLIIFVIIFFQTGVILTPFLPGDSLLFAAGTVAALDNNPLNVFFLVPMVIVAALIGDNTNYFVGKYIGRKIYEKNYRFIKRENLDKTHDFYEKHGGKALIIARFILIVRTFAPFIAGVGRMNYSRFLTFCVIGNVVWVSLFCFTGYYFSNIPFVKQNFALVILAIIIVSIIPIVIEYLKNRSKKKIQTT